MKVHSTAVALLLILGVKADRDLSLKLNKISQTTSPKAKCIDGTAPAYYWRDGTGNGSKSAILFLEGGGWCYPSDVEQASGANCAIRSKSGLGSSKSYPPSIASMGYEGGSGYTSGDPTKTAWSNWAAAYVKYCDGGSMTGTREDPMPQRNSSTGQLWYRGKYNLDAQLDHMAANHDLKSYKEIILSGCSAGGMACYIHCDYVASYFNPIPVKCICDAGIFLDVETVTGAGDVMQTRYHDIATIMESKPGLPAGCVAAETDWKQCIFSQFAIKHMQTPTFLINSLYNFGACVQLAREMLASSSADTGDVPADWAKCWPKNGALSPESFKQCNATQVKIINGYRENFISAVNNAIKDDTPHGAFLDACPNQHCQTSTGWNKVVIEGQMMADAAAAWYFEGKTVKLVDKPFPSNPTCGYKEGVQPMCNNCANKGIGSNCHWSEGLQAFHGEPGAELPSV